MPDDEFVYSVLSISQGIVLANGIKVFLKKVNVHTCAIFNSNKACIYFLGAKILQICILYIQISTTPISFHIETSLINSIEISDIYIRIKRLYLTLINFPQSGILYIHFGLILEAIAFQFFINRNIWTLFLDAMLMFRLQIPMSDVQ